MKRRMMMVVLLTLAACHPAPATDTVQPASCTATNFRGETQAYVSPDYYYEGASLLCTNCVVYSGGDTSAAVQGLNGVTIQVRVGSATTNILYSGTVQSAPAGTWWANINVPASSGGTVFFQVKLIDAGTNSYIYPWKMIKTMAPLR